VAAKEVLNKKMNVGTVAKRDIGKMNVENQLEEGPTGDLLVPAVQDQDLLQAADLNAKEIKKEVNQAEVQVPDQSQSRNRDQEADQRRVRKRRAEAKARARAKTTEKAAIQAAAVIQQRRTKRNIVRRNPTAKSMTELFEREEKGIKSIFG